MEGVPTQIIAGMTVGIWEAPSGCSQPPGCDRINILRFQNLSVAVEN